MSKVNVIIPAAGLGTRMRPLSDNISKTLIPVNGKPILHWILSSVVKLNCEIENIIIVQKNDDISKFINSTYMNTSIYDKIRVINQDESINGPAGAIISAVHELNSTENLLVWLGDTICLKTDFNFDESFVCTSKVDSIESPRWCCVSNDNNKFNLFDKVPTSTFSTQKIDALIGIYFFKNLSVDFEQFKQSEKEIQISELMNGISSYNPSIIGVQDTWYDCGELETFYKSKARLLNSESREQSNLFVDSTIGTVTKSGNTESSIVKLYKEYLWYKSCSTYQSLFVPKIISQSLNEKTETIIDSINDYGYNYTMSLESGTTLSDMFIYENIHVTNWKHILGNAIDIYHKYFIVNPIKVYNEIKNETVKKFYYDKPYIRIASNKDFYKRMYNKFDFNECISFISDTCKMIKNDESYSSMFEIDETNPSKIHGDFHFGNILFDSLTGKYTFLDPRGGTFYKNTVDSLYDMAKLYHDIYVGYMLLYRENVIDNETLDFSSVYKTKLNELINYIDEKLIQYGYNPVIVKRMSVILVLTCIPFHKENENRCKLFIRRSCELMKDFQ